MGRLTSLLIMLLSACEPPPPPPPALVEEPPPPEAPALELGRCFTERPGGPCHTSLRPSWDKPFPRLWGEQKRYMIADITKDHQKAHTFHFSQDWSEDPPSALRLLAQDYLPQVTVSCGRSAHPGAELGVAFLQTDDALRQDPEHLMAPVQRFGRALRFERKGEQVEIRLPEASGIWRSDLTVRLPEGAHLTLLDLGLPYRPFWERRQKVSVSVEGACGEIEVVSGAPGEVFITGQIEALRVDAPLAGVGVWLRPGAPLEAPLQLRARGVVVDLPEGHEVRGRLPLGWKTACVGVDSPLCSTRGGEDLQGSPAHRVNLNAPVGLLRWSAWERAKSPAKVRPSPAQGQEGRMLSLLDRGGVAPECLDPLDPACPQ